MLNKIKPILIGVALISCGSVFADQSDSNGLINHGDLVAAKVGGLVRLNAASNESGAIKENDVYKKELEYRKALALLYPTKKNVAYLRAFQKKIFDQAAFFADQVEVKGTDSVKAGELIDPALSDDDFLSLMSADESFDKAAARDDFIRGLKVVTPNIGDTMARINDWRIKYLNQNINACDLGAAVVGGVASENAAKIESAENDYSWVIKRYAPDPSTTYKLVSLEKDYFADYVEAQAKIYMNVAKKLRKIKSRYISSTSGARGYQDYLIQLAGFLGGIKPYLGAPLDELVVKVNMMRQFTESSSSWGDLLEVKSPVPVKEDKGVGDVE